MTLIWGTTWYVIRDQLNVVPVAWSVTYRFALSGLVMLVVARLTAQRLMLAPAEWCFVALFGLAQFVFNFNLVYQAERHIASGLVAVVFATLFVPNALLARMFLGQKTSGRFLVGSVLAVGGIALLFVNELQRDPAGRSETLLGIVLTLLAVSCASTANVMQGSKRAGKLPMATMLGWGMLFGATMDAIFAWTVSGPPVFEYRWGYVLGLGYLSVIASALAFTLYFTLIRTIGAARASYSSTIIPVIAMLISTFAEDYRWTGLAVAGAVLAMIGTFTALSAAKPST